MSLGSVVHENRYTGNGSVDTYSYTFRIFEDADLEVIVQDTDGEETTLTLTTHYTVTGEGSANGGSVALVNGAFDWIDGDGDLVTGFKLYIRRKLALTQETDFRNQGDFYPEAHEDQFDRVVMIAQQQQGELDRGVKLPSTVDPDDFNATLPTDIAGAVSKVPMTNVAGDGWLDSASWPTGDQIFSAQGHAEDAADSADEAAESVDTAADHVTTASRWANHTASTVTDVVTSVDSNEYSAKEYAIGTQRRGDADGGSAKDWANYTGGTVDDAEFSAKKYAVDAAASAAAAEQSAEDAEAAANFPINTKGDILIHDATGIAKLAVGANARVLSANSAQTAGLEWVVNTPADGTVTTAKIVDANVTRAKLAAGAVGNSTVTASKTTTYSATSSDDFVPCSASGGAFTVTLPAAASSSGKYLTFIKTDSSTNAVTIDGNASETINGAATTTLNTLYEVLVLVCDGSNWFIESRRIPRTWTTFTPTGTWTGGNVTYTGRWRRDGTHMEVEVKIALTGAPTGTQLRINMPTGYAIDNASMIDATVAYGVIRGSLAVTIDAGNNGQLAGIAYHDTAAVNVMSYIQGGAAAGAPIYTGNNVTNLVPVTFGSGDGVSTYWSVPIAGWNG
jgi:hypothetical protein